MKRPLSSKNSGALPSETKAEAHLHTTESINPIDFAFKMSPLPMAILIPSSNDFIVTEVNHAFAKGLGCREEGLISTGIIEFLKKSNEPDSKGVRIIADCLNKSIENKRRVVAPVLKYYEHPPQTTRSRYYQCEIIPNISANGCIDSILFSAKDVTERYKADRELRKSRQRLDSGQKIAQVGYWDLNFKQNRLFWSDEMYNILGLKQSEVDTCFDLYFNAIHPDDKEKYLESRSRTLAEGVELDIELRLIRKDGSYRWIRQKGKRVTDAKGQLLSFEGVCIDITDTKTLELAVRESNMRYRFVALATFDTIYEWDVTKHQFNFIENFYKNFGYTNEEVYSQDFWKSKVHPDDLERVLSNNRNALANKVKNVVNEYRFQKSNGMYAHVLERCFILRDEKQHSIRMIGAFQDITEKTKLQKLLNKTSRLAKFGSWELDVRTNTLFWSDSTKEIREVPYDFQPTLEDSIAHFRFGCDREKITKHLKEARETGKSWTEDYQIYTHKGNLKWIRAIGEAEMVDGRCIRLFGSFQDIDGQKKADLEIRTLLQEKELILDGIEDAFFHLKNNWTISYWSRQAEKILGLQSELVIGKTLWDTFATNIDPVSYHKYQSAMENQNRIHFDNYYEKLNKWFEVTLVPFEGGLSVFLRDFTERKLSRAKIEESEKRYSELFRLNPNPIWVYDRSNYQIIQVNQAAIELYGYTEEEFLKKTILDIRPLEDRTEFTKAIEEKRFNTGVFMDGRFRHLTKSGKILYIEKRGKSIMINNKEYRLVIITDMTEREQADQKVTRAIINTQENERYEIGAELHDNVCQILASTYITMGVIGKSIPDEQKERFRQCKDYIDLATREIRNLSHRLAPASISENTLKEAFEILINNFNSDQKYSFSFFYDEKIAYLPLDKELRLNLYRILQEGLNNIRKYAKCKKIEIGLFKNKHKIILRICDDGVGFEPEEATSGIGLANIRRRTELFRGDFEIVSSKGNGCELIIEIPLEELF